MESFPLRMKGLLATLTEINGVVKMSFDQTALELETLLALPDNGRVSIAGALYEYSISGSQLTLSAGLKRDLPQLSEVMLYAP